jgi:hypothetical protein
VHRDPVGRERFSVVAQLNVEPRVVSRATVRLDGNDHRTRGDVGRQGEMVDVQFRHRLEPDWLPNAGGAVVPDHVGVELPVLLPAGLGDIEWIVLRPHHESARAVAVERVGHIERERGVAALVVPEQRAAQPDRAPVVDGAEVQDRAAAGCGWRSDRPPVPDDRVKPRVVDAGCRRFRREGHDDRAVERRPVGCEPVLA